MVAVTANAHGVRQRDAPGVHRAHQAGSGQPDRSEAPWPGDRLRLIVHLSAELADGSVIRTPRPDFRLSGPRTGPGAIWHKYHGPGGAAGSADPPAEGVANYRDGLADIEDGVNQMLGRDPALHTPPRLAWENLLEALTTAGIAVDEPTLISAPLTLEVDREVQAQLYLS